MKKRFIVEDRQNDFKGETVVKEVFDTEAEAVKYAEALQVRPGRVVEVLEREADENGQSFGYVEERIAYVKEGK